MTADAVADVLARIPALMRDVPADRTGALWRLAAEGRQLDANLIRLTSDARVAAHVEPDVDVLLYVVDGTGRLDTSEGGRLLEAGCVVWLPRGGRRGVLAGPEGLAYLTVHRRRPGLSIRNTAAVEEREGDGDGGESACLLDRVCPACGRLAPDGSDVSFCGRCGSRLRAS